MNNETEQPRVNKIKGGNPIKKQIKLLMGEYVTDLRGQGNI